MFLVSVCVVGVGVRGVLFTVIQGSRVIDTSTCSFHGCPGIDIQLAVGERKNVDGTFTS